MQRTRELKTCEMERVHALCLIVGGGVSNLITLKLALHLHHSLPPLLPSPRTRAGSLPLRPRRPNFNGDGSATRRR